MTVKASPKRKKKPSQSYLTKKADTVFSVYIRQRDGYCQSGRREGCEGRLNLQCAHGFTRARYSTRWDERNAWALCRACHVFYTHRPDEWWEWMVDRLGREAYDELRALSLVAPWRGDKVAIAEHFKSMLEVEF